MKIYEYIDPNDDNLIIKYVNMNAILYMISLHKQEKEGINAERLFLNAILNKNVLLYSGNEIMIPATKKFHTGIKSNLIVHLIGIIFIFHLILLY